MSTLQAMNGYALDKDGGELHWVLDSLMEVKASVEKTVGAFSIVEIVANDGFGPPPHIHEVEDEAFYVISGGMLVVCGDDQWEAGDGAFVYLPKRVKHTFKFRGPTRALQITTPAGFDQFVREAGRPAPAPVVPEHTTPDISRLVEVAKKHGMDILLPK